MELEIPQIRELIELLDQTSLSELQLEVGEIKLSIKKGTNTQQITTAALPNVPIELERSPLVTGESGATIKPASTAAAEDTRMPDARLYLVRSPMVGIFYRSPAPDAPPFIEPGQFIEAGQVVCIIEAMKLLNEIESEQSGKVVRICIESGDTVEFGQVLIEIAS
ncbi:MAG: acetyl-CoA carboxylase biotin carboxyl carrier protein [Cyanobacteria bacterium NC_groundwater_1444_Ag_S-0.65um_54_12]|nr:acetyl-CoA carboxylase biotin carboxyl carrier protein [Cyanobacteria bacterium NC_groundwater_1444_Ag_S-0.65um_54_12]